MSAVPTSVIVPVAVTVTSPSSALTMPEIEAPDPGSSEPFSGVPSYIFSAEPVVTVAEAGLTVRVPLIVVTFGNCAVTSLPPAFNILNDIIVFSLTPASVRLPETSAEAVKPEGRPSTVNELSVRGVPS